MNRWAPALLCLFLLVAGTLFALRALNRPLNHDEQQFLAPPWLLEHEHLWPYRDFPLFHLPNLVFAYAAAGRFAGDLILGPKLLCIASTLGLLLLLVWLAYRIPTPATARALLAAVSITLLLCDPLFLYTAGKTWNHEIPSFLLVGAIVFQLEAFGRLPRLGPLLSGLFAGLAVGCRLTFAAPALALAIHFLLMRSTWRERGRDLLWWSGGFVVAMIPTICCFAAAPKAFLFDNLAFPRLRLLDPENTRIQKTVALSRKLRFFAKEVAPRSWILLVALSVTLAVWIRAKLSFRPGSALAFLMPPMALIGCFAPSRYQYQHYYVVIVILVVSALLILAEVPHVLASPAFRWGGILSAGLALAGATPKPVGAPDRRDLGFRTYAKAVQSFRPTDWFHARYRRQNMAVRELMVGRGDEVRPPEVLTLAPTIALSADLPIYADFATGVFAWRSARFVPAAQRRAFHFVAPEDMETLYGQEFPRAILTGVEDPEEERGLVEFAGRHGYTARPVSRQEVLWLAP